MAKTGTSYDDYRKRVTDCRIVVDKYLAENPETRAPQVRAEVVAAMQLYDDTLTWWSFKFAQGSVTYAVNENEQACRDLFQRRSELQAWLIENGYYTSPNYRIEPGIPKLWELASAHVGKLEGLLK